MSDDEEIAASGWNAIDQALRSIYGDREPLHWGTLLKYRLGGPDPIDGISAYPRDEPIPHWHFITYGFSELYQKELDEPTRSGWGFELTFRPARSPDEAGPPNWVLNFLQNLGRYVFSKGNPFDVGHYMNLNGPIALGVDTEIRAIVFVNDPELPPIDTPNGRVAFLQVVGITLDELGAIIAWNPRGMADLLREHDPMWITRLDRSSIRREAAVEARVREGMARDGSSSEVLFVQVARFRAGRPIFGPPRLTLTLGAHGVRDLPTHFAGRLPFGRELMLTSGDAVIVFKPGDDNGWTVTGGRELEVTLNDQGLAELGKVLVPTAGRYPVPGLDHFEVVIEKSVITDAEDKTVDVIG